MISTSEFIAIKTKGFFLMNLFIYLCAKVPCHITKMLIFGRECGNGFCCSSRHSMQGLGAQECLT